MCHIMLIFSQSFHQPDEANIGETFVNLPLAGCVASEGARVARVAGREVIFTELLSTSSISRYSHDVGVVVGQRVPALVSAHQTTCTKALTYHNKVIKCQIDSR